MRSRTADRERLPRPVRSGRSSFLLLALAGTAFVAVTLHRLPPRMAIHFNLYGAADNWAGREAYVVLLMGIGLLLPVGIVALVARLGATSPGLVNVPGKDYWFRPERRAEGVARVTDMMWWLGCLMLALTIAVHGLLLVAHEATPPSLPTGPFIVVLAGFVLGVLLWSRSLTAAMRPPSPPDHPASAG